MKTMEKTGPAGPKPKTTTPAGSFTKSSAKAKPPIAKHESPAEYPVKKGDGTQPHNPARQAQGKTIRYLR
jgi:hypothetical protein